MGRRVAVASADGRFVDTHFGHAERFDVYELGKGGFAFVGTRSVASACTNGRHDDASFDAVLGSLSDCEAVFVSVIGYGAARYLNRKGMRVFESPYSLVEEVLGKVSAEGLLDGEDGMRSLVIHGGVDGDERTGAVSVPIYQTSTFRQDGIGGMRAGYEYSRSGNPTREALEKLIAELEGGPRGSAAGFAFASGLAATTAVLFLFRSGDKLLMSRNVYGGTYRLLDKVFKDFGLSFELVDATDLGLLERKLTEDVKGLILESPTNPLLEVADIAAAAGLAKERGALTIVDNTFMTPYLQRPLDLGADIVIHSATKYLGGHSDLIAGLAVVKDPAIAERLKFIQNASGGILQPFDSWLLIRGIKTLAVRMDRHVSNAERIASALAADPRVKRVYYPGLPDSPGYAVNRRQARGGGAVIAFELAEGCDVLAFSRAVRMIVFGESLGGVESILTHPATMTHAAIPAELRAKVGITDGLLRLSVGIEDADDILRDLDRGFDAAKTGGSAAEEGRTA